MRKRVTQSVVLFLAIGFVMQGSSQGAIVELGDLNIINDAGNPSDGLRFLDMTFSVGLNKVAALANAQASYPNARLATPSEFDDLFAAANISYNGALTASDAFTTGATTLIVNSNANIPQLVAQLGATTQNAQNIDFTQVWSDPDGSDANSSTRDYLTLGASLSQIVQITVQPAFSTIGWLIVDDAPVPEPSTIALAILGMVGITCTRRKHA